MRTEANTSYDDFKGTEKNSSNGVDFSLACKRKTTVNQRFVLESNQDRYAAVLPENSMSKTPENKSLIRRLLTLVCALVYMARFW